MAIDLYRRSVEIILENQSETGAYIASPNFPTYEYCWFRDGAFSAHAMNLAGENESAVRFHHWVANAINRRKTLIQNTIAKAGRGEPIRPEDALNTRYTVEGEPAEEEWPNFQLDGFGTWLWALAEHQAHTQTQLPADWLEAAGLIADYLASLWALPCYDCWEEFPDQVHTHTLASIYAGLDAHRRITGPKHERIRSEISRFIMDEGHKLGYLPKFIGSDIIDASLIGLSVPYRVVPVDHPIMLATIEKIETDIHSGGGLRRYSTDTYYGGGEWILLTAWLGWYYAEKGDRERALAALKWVESQADVHGNLPEQVPSALTDSVHFEAWRERWGEIAIPLLWSHAKYIILVHALGQFSQ